MKVLKIALIILSVLVFLTPLIFGMIITAVNDNTSDELERELLSLPLPENTIVVESLSVSGKLWGNGNGMQYYGAMLIDSELPLDELKIYYSQYNCEVNIQKTNKIDTDHGELHFAAPSLPKNAFIVEKFGNGAHFIFEEFDIRGR